MEVEAVAECKGMGEEEHVRRGPTDMPWRGGWFGRGEGTGWLGCFVGLTFSVLGGTKYFLFGPAATDR
jgi:hypothetical protein